MAKVQDNGAASAFADLAGALEQALDNVKASKRSLDDAKSVAVVAQTAYQGAVQAAQKARSAYDAHVNEAMSGFAQIHQ